MPQTAQIIEKEIIHTVKLDYLRYLPADYAADSTRQWPLILFLHGAGERGNDLALVKKHGIARVVEERGLPFVTLSPQCPADHWWSDYLPVLDALITKTEQECRIDPRRIYLTGLSMGGFGTWHMACEYPRRFAAIMPICGGGAWMYGMPERLADIRHLPTWVFHGAQDPTVPLSASQDMVAALQQYGGDVRFTIYPDADHDSWTETYNNPAIYDWFLSHQSTE